MNIHDEHATWATDEQIADTLGTLQDMQQIELEGCTVHVGQHPAQGRLIVIEASAGMSLILAERPAGEEASLDASDPKTIYDRLAADPRVECVHHTLDGQLRIAVTGKDGTRAKKVAPEQADHAVAQLVALLRPDAA